jgi:hypothetical protein
MAILFMNILMTIFTGYLRPMITKVVNRVVIGNEFFI